MISLLVAHDLNRVIGLNNDLPWHIPEDLAYFKKMTLGKAIIMGRKTYESIGRPLPGRLNIVLTKNESYTTEGVLVFNDLNKAIEKAQEYNEEVMVIGGSEIFKMVLDVADRLYITVIEKHFDGDTFFPTYDSEWEISSTSEKELSKNGIPYTFFVYERKQKI